MKRWWGAIRPYVLGALIYPVARGIGLTLRIEMEGFEELQALEGGRIYAGWHGRTFVAANAFKGLGVWTIISQSRDGEMQNFIFRRFGFNTVRGSTNRGGIRAALESVKVLRAGATMAFTPDGPRGPSGVVQAGILLMARKSGAALVPVGVSADRRWLAPSWDRYLVPKPFARCLMIFGRPIYLPDSAGPEQTEAVRQLLESEMHQLQALAERRCGHAA